MGLAKAHTLLIHSRARPELHREEGRVLLASSLLSSGGAGARGKIHSWGLYDSWVLAKLSDLSQELKGILYGFKIFYLTFKNKMPQT